MDRIAGVWDEDDVAGRCDSLCEIGEPLLRAKVDDLLALRIRFDAKPARVISGEGAPQARNATGHRIPVSFGVVDRLDELGDDMGRRGSIGIAHAEIDDITPCGARLCLQRVYLVEDIRG